jgi:hypothetical protein
LGILDSLFHDNKVSAKTGQLQLQLQLQSDWLSALGHELTFANDWYPVT